MRPVFANSATVDAPEWLMLRRGRFLTRRLRVRYAFLEHPEHGPVLIDTGCGPRVTEGAGRSVALKAYARMLAPRLVQAEQPIQFLAARGYSSEDVRLVVVTHFHADHVANLKDFPNAEFVVDGAAFARIKSAPDWKAKRHGVFRELLPDDFEKRIVPLASFTLKMAHRALGDGRDIFGDGSVLAVVLPGHADGHFGLFFPRAETPLLYAVDTQWLTAALEPGRMPGFPASLIADDKAAMALSVEAVRAFKDAGGEVVLCHEPLRTAHDFETGDG